MVRRNGSKIKPCVITSHNQRHMRSSAHCSIEGKSRFLFVRKYQILVFVHHFIYSHMAVIVGYQMIQWSFQAYDKSFQNRWGKDIFWLNPFFWRGGLILVYRVNSSSSSYINEKKNNPDIPFWSKGFHTRKWFWAKETFLDPTRRWHYGPLHGAGQWSQAHTGSWFHFTSYSVFEVCLYFAIFHYLFTK